MLKYLIVSCLVLLVLSSTFACGGSTSNNTPASTPHTTAQTEAGTSSTGEIQQTTEDVIFTIGNLTDKTGPAAQAMQYIDLALEDAIEYYNNNDLIPGVKLEIIEYDTQYSTSRLIPGYKWLKNRNIDVLTSFLPITPGVLDPFINEDKLMFFTANAEREFLYPPGYTFAWACLWEELAYTQLEWIAETQWDYHTNGPAKLGGAGWKDGATDIILRAAHEYTNTHPEQYTWIDGYLTDFTFSWQAEVEGLKDCDYIFIPSIMHMFASDYADAGLEKATFLASEPQTAFLGMVSDADLWNKIDGTLFAMNARWWDQEMDEFHQLVGQVMQEAHPDESRMRDLKRAGRSYITAGLFALMCEIIKDASEQYGPENVDSQSVYWAAQNFSFTVDGLEWANFSRNKRNSYNYFIMSEADADQQTLVTASDWIPVKTEP